MAKWLLVLLTFSFAVTRPQVLPSDSARENRANSSETDKQIETLQDLVKRSPENYPGFDGLGAHFLQKARETGEIDYYNLAEQALKKALALVPQDLRATDPSIHTAVVCMGEHRFADAFTFAQRAIATGSGNDQAQQAYDTVQALGRLSIPPLMLTYMSDSRLAYLR
jgi:tetratricopeptide (TPR) repeat protein